MPLPSWCDDTITVTRAQWVDERGTRVRDWTYAQTHFVKGCSVQPARTETDDRASRARATATSAVIYCPPGADVEAGDRIEFDGAKYEVQGEPLPQRSPFGGCDHLLVNVTAWKG